MTELVIRCKIQGRDILALNADEFLRNPMLLICGVIFAVFLAAMPVIRLIMLTLYGKIDLILIFYLLALAAMIWVNIKNIKSSEGVSSEYTFSENGFTVKDKQGECNLNYSSVFAVTETKKYFYIKPEKYTAYIIPKTYITAEEGETLRSLFVTKFRGRKYDCGFCAEGSAKNKYRAEEPETPLNSIEFQISEDYPKAAAAASLSCPSSLILIFFMSMLIAYTVSFMASSAAAIIAAAAYTALALFSAYRQKLAKICGMINTDKTAVYRFYKKGFEYSQCGNTTAAEYDDILRIKKGKYFVFIMLKNSRYFVMPVNDEVSEVISKNTAKK